MLFYVIWLHFIGTKQRFQCYFVTYVCTYNNFKNEIVILVLYCVNILTTINHFVS